LANKNGEKLADKEPKKKRATFDIWDCTFYGTTYRSDAKCEAASW
jgi:hypothetical protein